MKKIAIANLKGGVGKSTTALFLAELWALRGKRVLVLDLDPQSNLSLMLLSRQQLLLQADGIRTLPRLLRDSMEGTVAPAINYVVPRVSDLQELRNNSPGYVYLLPSVPRLSIDEYVFDEQCWQTGRDPLTFRQEILSNFLAELENQFDCVIMDCQPGFGAMMRAALVLADHIISPTIADQISVRSLGDFVDIGMQEHLSLDLTNFHIVVSKFANTADQRRELDLLRQKYPRNMRLPTIPYRDQVTKATVRIDGLFRSFTEKYRRPLLRPISAHVEPLAEAMRLAIFGP